MTVGAGVLLHEVCENLNLRKSHQVVSNAAKTISTPLLRNMGTIGGNLLLDTRCNYYDQNYEWRKGINFCLKKDGDVCWVAPGSSKCWAVQSSDLVPVMVAIGAKLRFAKKTGRNRRRRQVAVSARRCPQKRGGQKEPAPRRWDERDGFGKRFSREGRPCFVPAHS